MKAVLLALARLGVRGLGGPGERWWVENSSLVINLLFLGFAPGFRFKWRFAFFVSLRCSAMATAVVRGWGRCLWLTPCSATGAGGSAHPPKLVQLCMCTNTFPFYPTLKREIWISLLYEKGLEALLSVLSAVVSAIQTQAGFGGGSAQQVRALLTFWGHKRSWVGTSVPVVQHLLDLTML